MIKTPDLPAIGVVALLALDSQFLLVHILLGMTGITGLFRVLVGGGQVTLFAGGDRMQANQREARQVVIETHFLAPAILIVAVLALLALLAAMSIIVFVAAVAIHRQLFLVRVALVATAAGGLLMLAI